MIGRDLLLRGRPATGGGAPAWLVGLLGAAVGLLSAGLADALGFWRAAGVSGWGAGLALGALGALVGGTRLGALLWLPAGGLSALWLVVTLTPWLTDPVLRFVRDDAEQPVDAVAVLSGSITPDGRLTGAALDRLLTGLAEARRRNVRNLLLSELRQGPGRGVVSSSDQRALAALADSTLEVVFVRDVASTRDEAERFVAVARQRGWRRVLLVTSPSHSRRACATVEQVGLAVECRPSEARDWSPGALDEPGTRLLAFADVVYELAATALYRWRGWID